VKRADRLQIVQNVVDDQKRHRAEALAVSERRVAESEAKLAELQNYQASYLRDFSIRAESGMDGVMARDYQAFLARLEEALRQQSLTVTRARAQRDGEMQSWQGAAQRAEAVGQMVRRFQSEEELIQQRREQHDTDERAQRLWAYGMIFRGT
jgi:flagellar FliJ protein